MKFVALLTLCCVAASASTISGAVSDAQGRAVPNAAILLLANIGAVQLSTHADSSGRYHFADVKAGDCLLEAHAPGFAVYRVEHVHVSNGENLTVNFPLSIDVVQQQISVTASSTPQAVDQVSKALDVVTNESIQQRQDSSLIDAIRLVPGIRIEQEGGPGSFSDIRIRGLRPEDTAVLVDGMRLRDVSGTQADASSLIEDFLITDDSRIEILRGSGSSLYGTDAIGGVVNVITSPGGGGNSGSLLLEGGSLGLFRGTAAVAGGTKNDRIQYSAGLVHLNVVNGVNDDNPARTSSVQGRIAYRLTPATQLIARFLGALSYTALNDEPVALIDNTGTAPAIPYITYTPAPKDPDYRRDGRFDTGELSVIGQPTSNLGYAIHYQVVDSTRQYWNGPAGSGYQPLSTTRSDYNGLIQTANATVSYQAGRHNLLTGGYEFEDESFNTFSVTPIDPASYSFISASQTSNTAFAQDQIRLFGDRLYVSLGFRSQLFSLNQPTFTPAAQAPYQNLHLLSPPAAYTGDGSFAYFLVPGRTKVRAHVGRGYRAPALYERFGAGYDSFFGYSVYGNPYLQPEQSISADGGIEQSVFNNKLRISGTYFYTHLQRVITFDFSGLINPMTDPFGRFEGYLNTRGGLSRGVELSEEWAVNTSLTVNGSYTYTDAREHTPLIPGVYRTLGIPKHQVTAFAVQRFGKHAYAEFALNAASNYLAEMYSADFTGGAYRFPGYKRADVGLSYQLPVTEALSIRFFGKAQNLFNQNYYEAGFPTGGITARGGLQFEF